MYKVSHFTNNIVSYYETANCKTKLRKMEEDLV